MFLTHHRRRGWNAVVPTLFAVALVAAACGGGESADTESSTTTAITTTTAPTTTAEAPATTSARTTTTAPTTTVAPTTTTEPGPEHALRLTVDGWPELQNGATYEGWLIVGDTPVSSGKFNVMDGVIVRTDGSPIDVFALEEDPSAAAAFVVTIEPAGDADPAPADTHFLAGDIVGGVADLTIGHPAALGTDFSDATGEFVLATPTDGDRTNDEHSGVWFLVFPGPTPGLDLPELPAGWIYEGWTVIEAIPVTTGTFVRTDAEDDAAPYSGTVRTPNFPGEDFLVNAPDGLTFPTDLSGATVVVSVEPLTEDNRAPFVLKPLVGDVPADAELEPVSYPITNGGFMAPTGRVDFG